MAAIAADEEPKVSHLQTTWLLCEETQCYLTNTMILVLSDVAGKVMKVGDDGSHCGR